jgi:hypothetical protein
MRTPCLLCGDKSDIPSSQAMTRHWSDITPADAAGIILPREDIIGPVNEAGEPCPWPWEPQELVGVPLGQYHCSYCLAMVIAGLPHVDYTDDVG